MLKLITLLLFSASAFAGNQNTREIRATNTDGFSADLNLVKNPGFERNATSWTSSSPTIVINTTAANVGSGSRSASWDSSAASQTLTSEAVAIPAGDYAANYEVSANLQCASGTCTHLLQAFDGTNVVASQTITSSLTYFRTTFNFVAPSSGNLSARIVSVASNEPNLFVDDVYVGRARNVGSVAQAVLVGSGYFATTGSCQWTRTNTALGSFSTIAACPGPTVDLNPGPGTLQTTDTDLPKWTFNSLPPGNYQAIVTLVANSATGGNQLSFALNDGTDTKGHIVTGSTVTRNGVTLVANFNYTSTANRTFEVLGAADSGEIRLDNQSTNARLSFQLYRFPSSPEIAVRPEQMQNWGNALLSLSSQTTFSHSTSTWTDATNAGFTGYTLSGKATAIGSNRLGITIPQLSAGTYRVSARLAGRISTAEARCNIGIFDGTTRATSQGSVTGGPDYAWTGETFTGTFTYTSQADRSFYIQVSRAAGTGTCNIDVQNGASGNFPEFEITVYPISQSLPAPVLVGSVTSQSVGAERIERARIANSGTCTTTSQSGSWVSSLSRPGTGQCTITFATNLFSGTPACVCTVENAGYGCALDSISSSAVTYRATVTSTGANSDQPVDIVCMGPRGNL